MARNSIAVTLMLFAGAITSIIVFIKDYTLPHRMLALVTSLLVFYTLGIIIQKVLRKFDKENRERREREAREAKEAEKAAEKAKMNQNENQ